MVWVVRGHSRSPEIAPFYKAHMNEFTLAVHRNNVSILQIVEITFSVACGKCWLFDKPYQNLVKCIFTLNYRTVSYKSGTRNALVMHLCTWTIRRNRTVCSHSEFQAENQWNVCLYIWLKLSVCLSVCLSQCFFRCVEASIEIEHWTRAWLSIVFCDIADVNRHHLAECWRHRFVVRVQRWRHRRQALHSDCVWRWSFCQSPSKVDESLYTANNNERFVVLF